MGIPGENAGDPGVPPLKRRSPARKAFAALLRFGALWLVGLLLLVAPPFFRPADRPVPAKPAPPPPADPPAALPDFKDNDAFLSYLRRHVLSPSEREETQALIERLADESFQVRYEASERLATRGPRVAGMLRRASRSADSETAEQARQLRARVLIGHPTGLIASAIRTLVLSGRSDAVSALLDYLPDAEEDALLDEARAAIVSLGLPDEAAERSALAALTDPLPERRAAAAVLLAPLRKHRPALRAHLDADPDPDVRYRTALALLSAREPAAIRTLIDLLSLLPQSEAWTALDLLYQAGGANAPAVPLGSEARQRGACRDAWMRWWERDGVRLDLSHLELTLPGGDRPRGTTLLIYLEFRSLTGEVIETGDDGGTRRTVLDADYPIWAEQLPGGGLLVVEYRIRVVSERDVNGIPVRATTLPSAPVYAHRLPDGETFVACRESLWKVDADGAATLLTSRDLRSIVTARLLPDGTSIAITDEGECLYFDANGIETRRRQTGIRMVLGAGIDVTANGRLLLPDYEGDRVVELSPSGEVLWELRAGRPTSVQRLANGHTLIASSGTEEVYEVDRLGREVWRLPSSGRRADFRSPLGRPLIARRIPIH